MSQIGNKIKAGFVATPERQGEYLRQLLSFQSDTSVLDPTCGEGLILAQLIENRDERTFAIESYGVELDKRRAAIAKEMLDKVVQAPIESMVISHDVFGLLFLNPPYDHTMVGVGDDQSERKEYTELVRNTKYLAPGGVIIYIIPSYRYADNRIARYLATHFEDVAITKFSDEDYEDYKQCIFIGRKKAEAHKKLNDKMFAFLQEMKSETFVLERVTPLNQLITRKLWEVPGTRLDIPTFYSRIENKREQVDLIRFNKGFHAFIERTKTKKLVVGGEPIINIAQGQMALLLASGAVNGVIGEGDTLHAVQGMEIVSHIVTEEKTEYSTVTKKRTKRDVSVKVITPDGKVKKFV